MAIELADSIQDDQIEVNPFDEGVTPGQYFADQVRTLSFNKLVHLAPYTELLMVSGPFGVGKTALLAQFVSKAADTWRTALVQVREADTDSDLLLKVIEGVEMPLVTTDESRGILVDSLARFLESLGRSGRRAIIVLDDAQKLSDEQLGMLAGLLADYRADNALSIILVGAPDLESRLEANKELSSRLTYTLRLEPLAQGEVHSYINQRLGASGVYEKSGLFSQEVVDEIYIQSEGYPARINSLAKKVLDTRTIERVRHPSGKAGIGRWLMLALGVLIAIPLLMFQEEINRFFEPQIVLEAEPGVGNKEVGVTESQIPATVFEQVDSLDKGGSPEQVSSAKPASSADVSSKVVSSAVGNQTALVEVPKEEESAQLEVEKEAKLEPAPQPVEVSEVKVPALKPEPAPKKPAPLSEEHKWLLSQPPTNYTLQLMALKDEAKVRRFVSTNKLQGNSAIFYITRRGSRLAVLVFGSFANGDVAKSAAAKLPKSWGVKQPWARSFDSVQAEYKAEKQD